LATISQSDPEFVVVLNDPFAFTYRKVIVEAERFRLPSIYGYREFVEDGGMISQSTERSTDWSHDQTL
jgi:hypothetical protein